MKATSTQLLHLSPCWKKQVNTNTSMNSSSTAPPLLKCSVQQTVKRFCINKTRGIQKPVVTLPASKLGTSFEAQFFRCASDLPDYWEDILLPHQSFMSRHYLSTFELAPPPGMSFAYLAILHQGRPIALFSFQLITFNTLDQLRDWQIEPADKGWKRWRKAVVGQVLARLDFRLLVLGATQFTGPHGFVFDSSTDLDVSQQEVMEEGIAIGRKLLTQQGWRPQAILVKDFYRPIPWSDDHYHPFPFLPNMLLPIRSEWRTFDDYLDSMLSKYRVRAKRAFKKAEPLDMRELNLAEVKAREARMYELYSAVEGKAEFSLIKTPHNYFTNLKEQLGSKFRVFAYFLDQQMVGFFTTQLNGHELEAHFMGLDDEHNHPHQLYLNMLYQMVSVAIEEKVELLLFARTASAIKSSVGAVPAEMHCYLKHYSPIINAIFPQVVKRVEPTEEWIQRHPFGKQED